MRSARLPNRSEGRARVVTTEPAGAAEADASDAASTDAREELVVMAYQPGMDNGPALRWATELAASRQAQLVVLVDGKMPNFCAPVGTRQWTRVALSPEEAAVWPSVVDVLGETRAADVQMRTARRGFSGDLPVLVSGRDATVVLGGGDRGRKVRRVVSDLLSVCPVPVVVV